MGPGWKNTEQLRAAAVSPSRNRLGVQSVSLSCSTFFLNEREKKLKSFHRHERGREWILRACVL